MNRLCARIGWVAIFGWVCLMAGCGTFGGKDSSGTAAPETITQDGETIPVYFPACFLIKNARLNDHGRIPKTRLVGAGITAPSSLSVVHRAYQDVLNAHGWTVVREEKGPQSFRILASLTGADIEIRAVQGTSGPTQIFLLYTPANP